MINITPGEIKPICQYVYSISGISLDEAKSYLIETRLRPLAQDLGCSSYIDLCHKAKTDSTGSLQTKIIDAITTGETLFFRDNLPFELLRHRILPDLIDRRRAKFSGVLPTSIRIWSAACSTGQEVYSIAMVLKELLPDIKQFNIKLLGTDISSAAIARASLGQYNRFEIDRGLPKEKLEKYFVPHGNMWKIKEEIRAMVAFSQLNLTGPLTNLGKFDIVFCRNVGIYFSFEDRVKLFNKMADILEPDGYLMVGSTESLAGVCPRFEPQRHLRSIYYQLKG